MGRTSTAMPLVRQRRIQAAVDDLARVLEAQRADVQGRFESGASTLVSKAWDARLAEVVFLLNNATASEVSLRVAQALAGKDHGFDPAVMEAWLLKNADITAQSRNQATRDDLAAAKASDDIEEPVDHVFGILLNSGAALMAASMVTRAMNFGGHDAARSVGASMKVWDTGPNPRAAHAALAGEAVGIDGVFSNGGSYPGDPALSADDNAGCNCSTTLVS